MLGKTVYQLRRELTTAELTAWIAYLQLEPPDDPMIWDWRFAMLASTTAQAAGVPRHKATISKFMPQRKKTPTVHTGADQAKIIEAFTGTAMPANVAKRFGA